MKLLSEFDFDKYKATEQACPQCGSLAPEYCTHHLDKEVKMLVDVLALESTLKDMNAYFMEYGSLLGYSKSWKEDKK